MAYHKIDTDSINSITNALDLFTLPPTNVSVSSAKVFEILPSNPLSSTPFHFKIHSSQNYIDLSKCYLFTEFKILKKDGSGKFADLPVNENVAPVQMIGSTFINNIRITITGREIFNSNSLMAYKTYFSHEFCYSPSAKQSHMGSAGYTLDLDDTSLEAGGGFDARKAMFAKSKTVQCISKIDADLFNQPLYLINHCEIDIEILPHNDQFLIIAPGAANDGQYRLEVVSCKLYIKKISLMDGLALDMARRIEQRPARYPLRKSMMKSLHIDAGRYEFTGNLFMDQVPRRIILGLVANDDYVGRYSRSPFNFQNFNVREISIVSNGRMYPQAPYDFDYENDKYVRAFHDMNEAIGFTNTLEGNGINYDRYGKTHCIYVFNMTNSGDDQAGVFDLIKSGATAVSIKFAKEVPAKGVVLVVMGEMDSLLMVDRNRTVASDSTI